VRAVRASDYPARRLLFSQCLIAKPVLGRSGEAGVSGSFELQVTRQLEGLMMPPSLIVMTLSFSYSGL